MVATNARLVAVVTTHNRLDQIKTTVARLLSEECAAVVVVNNASTDGTQEWLEAISDPRVHCIHSAKNLGGAGGFEVGLRAALNDFNPDWVVVMDDDGRPTKGCFADFLASDKLDYGIISAAVYFPNGQICEMNRPSLNPFWHLKALFKTATGSGRQGFHISDAEYRSSNILPVDAASFVGMFISAKTLRENGFPDGRLFIYGDDVLYSLRIRKAGVKIGFAPNIRFEHDCSTFQDGERVYRPYWKIYYNYRNGLMMYREASGLFFPLVLLWVVPKWMALGKAYGQDRGTFSRLLKQALRDGVRRDISRPHEEIVRLAEVSGSK